MYMTVWYPYQIRLYYTVLHEYLPTDTRGAVSWVPTSKSDLLLLLFIIMSLFFILCESYMVI